MTILKRIWRTMFSWSFRLPLEEELEKAELIVTQAWSRNADNTPGPGNEILAKVAKDYHERFGQLVFAQEEVAWCLPPHVPQTGVAGGSPDGRSGASWDTYAVAHLQAAHCHRLNIKTVIVVAHPLHMNRALWTYERLGLKALPASMPKDYAKYQGPNLVHATTRGHWLIYWLRESCLARPLFLIQGKI